MAVEKAFGQVLKKYRTSRNLSQEALALECGLHRTYISILERGLKNPTLGNVFLIAEVLGVEVEDLIKEVALVYKTMK